MSVISLDSGKLNTVSFDIKTLDENILKEMSSISEILGKINTNVKGDINKSLTDMVTKYSNVQSSLKNNFVKLETFLDEQLKSYVLTEEQLEDELYKIIIRIRDFEVKQINYRRMMQEIIDTPKINEPDNIHYGYADGVGAYIETLLLSFATKFLDLGTESIVDAHVYVAGSISDHVPINDPLKGRDWKGFISHEYIDYDYLASNINPDIAYGWAHGVGDFLGEGLGYKALSTIPGAGVALCAVGGAGMGVENNMNKQLSETGQINDWEVFGASLMGSAKGFSTGWMLKNLTSKTQTTDQLGNVVTTPAKLRPPSFAQATDYLKNTGLKQKGIDFLKIAFKDGPSNALKDPRTYANFGSGITEFGISKFADYDTNFSKWDFMNAGLQAFMNCGIAGLDIMN